MDFKKHLDARGCTVLKQFRTAEDRCICLVRCPDGSSVVWRFYDRPVLAYKTLLSVKCPELPEVYHYTEIESGCLVEEEYVDGISLACLIETHRLDDYQTAAIAHQICNALLVLHHKNMVHRDIKPENILITSDGRVVLIDLDAVSPRTSSKDRDTQLLGTVGYAAPEQYGFGHSDGRTDIFGMGVLMNVLLTSKHPVQKLTDGTLRPIVEKCIAVNVDQRYASVEELMAQLPNHTIQRCPSCGFISPGGGCIFCGIHAPKTLTKLPHIGWAIAVVAFLVALIGVLGSVWVTLHPENDVQADHPPSTIQSDLPLENIPSSGPTSTNNNLPAETNTTTPSDSPNTFSDSSVQSVISPEPMSEPPANSPEPTPEPSINSPEPTPEPPINSPEPTPEPPAVSEPPPEDELLPQETSPVSTEILPVFPGEPTHEITSFLYDLDGDSTSEEYYFGLMAEMGAQAMFASKLVVTGPRTEDSVSIRKFAPAVWSMNAAGTLIPVSQFAPLLQEVGITFYQYKGNDTIPTTQATAPLYGVWGGAQEISCGYEDTGNWIAVVRAVLNGTELTSYSNVVIRPSSAINNTPLQPILLTDGVPVDDPFVIDFNSKNELLLGDCEFYGCTAQYLDNDHIRFTVDYSGPVVQSLTIFNPPDGSLFKYNDRSGTSGARELLIFDLPAEQLHAVTRFTITFNCGNGSRFLVVINTSGL